jgi:acetyltransferase-like isoleucine patch superfamily enzyme
MILLLRIALIKLLKKFDYRGRFDIDKYYHISQLRLHINYKNSFGKGNKIIIGKNNRIEGLKIVIQGNNNVIKIGKNNRLDENSSIWIEGNNLSTQIGDNCTFEGVHLANTENNTTLEIGNDCMFSSGIEIRTGDSHSIVSVSEQHLRLNHAKNVTIGNHVWVGAHVSILKGVFLADNNIVGTKSVVTKSFLLENTVIAGCPARVVKENVDWVRERI